MRFGRVMPLFFWFLVGCGNYTSEDSNSAGSGTPDAGGTGSGGVPSSGGASGGGSANLGGQVDPSSGGLTGRGGGSLTGGVVGNGGIPSSGGGTVGGGSSGGSGQGGRGGAAGSGGVPRGGSGAGGGSVGGQAGSGSGGAPLAGAANGGSSGSPAGGSAGATGGVAGDVVAQGGSEPVGDPGPPYTYPQNNRGSYCVYPAAAHSDHAKAAYETWKTDLVTSDGANGFLRVRRPGTEEDTTVSEGIGYGMILAVVMDDQASLDAFWQYSQGLVNENGLMNWLIGPDGQVREPGAATDADEDMAWALALAAHKWGGRGSLSDDYSNLAQQQIQRIWDHEIDHGKNEFLVAGDSWGPTVTYNPSYFAPNEYRLFGKITGKVDDWNRVIDRGYEMLLATLQDELGNANNGLVPAWADEWANPMQPFDGAPTHYQYDSARTPFRIGMDYCEFGDARAKTYLDKTSSFFAGIGAANIVDGYELNGTARPENTSPAGVQAALFVGAAGVGAMSSPNHQAFVDEVYLRLVNQPRDLMLPPSYYFNLSWKVFSLLAMSGNLFDYTLHP